MVDIETLMRKYREGLLYIVCGGVTTLVTWLTYAVFVFMGIDLNISNVLSWVCGITFAFVVNKWIVFSSRSIEANTVLKEFGSFICARIFTGAIAIILFPILFNLGLNQSLMGVEGFLAKIVTSILEIGLNWIFSKYYIFKHYEDDTLIEKL